VSPSERRVVFIGGSSYSGSTALNLMLGHGPGCFAAGEVVALFRPTRPHHREPRCGCGDAGCRLWLELRACGEQGWLRELWRRMPELRTAIDSSKSVDWILQQSRALAAAGAAPRPLLIWKTPEAFAHSMRKRARTGWARDWTRYHLAFLAHFPDALCVSHAALASDPAGVLERLCAALELPYFAGKERYWEEPQHLLFGNTSARRHLYASGTPLAAAVEAQARAELRSAEYELAPHRGNAAGGAAPSLPEIAAACEAEAWLPELARLFEQAGALGTLPARELEALLRSARPTWPARFLRRLGGAAGRRRSA